jgi:type I restriction enzyme S subunit
MKYPAYPKYKDSGVAWLGELPEYWEVKGLRYVCRLAYGDSLAAENREEGEIPVYGSNGQVGSHIISNTKSPVIVVGRKGSFGKINYSDRSVFAIDTTYYIDGNCTSNSLNWLKYALLVLRLDESSKDSAVPGLAREDAYSSKLPVPSYKEQTVIADFLDRETGRIDTLVAKKRKLVELLKEKRSALISRSVTRGLPADAAREFGLESHTSFKQSSVEWLGEVPDGWGALPLRRLIKYVKTGGTPTGAEERHFENEGFNWYSPSDFSEAVYLGASARALSEEGKTEVRIFPPMAVMLVGIGATIGKVGLAQMESSCNQQINGIVCDINLDPVFATYYLKTMRDFIVKCGKYTTMPIINQDETKNLIFTVPPNAEQTAIATYLDRETAKIDRLAEKVEAAIVRLQEYRTSLITATVTGKIDVREYV